MKKIALVASFSALALIGIAHAAETQMDGMGADRPDANRTVARADALARAGQMFDRMDVNKDGKLDPADREARRAAVFDRIDANKDGSISRAEFSAMPPRPGPDGQARDGMGQGGMMGHHMMGGGMRGGMRGHGMMMMRMADTNRDGAVSKAEFTAAAAARFDRADSNHDGQVTPDERKAAHAAMRDAMQQHRHDAGTPAAPAN